MTSCAAWSDKNSLPIAIKERALPALCAGCKENAARPSCPNPGQSSRFTIPMPRSGLQRFIISIESKPKP
jgi:hypothetical protein